MRTLWLVLALALILPVAGCDTTQPTDAGDRLVSISVSGTAKVNKWNVWDVWIDEDGNCEIDEPPDGEDYKATYLSCDELERFDTTVPWPYSAEVSIIRAGTTEEELIATSVGTPNEFSNLSFYDEFVIQELPDQCSGIEGGELWVNGRQISAAHEEVMARCLGEDDLLPVNVLGQPDRYDIVAQRGDTIIFRSRKSPEGRSGPYDDIIFDEDTQISFPVTQTAVMLLDGVEVEAQGDPVTGDDDGGGITISLRLQ
jgi:hypothetical protein